MTCESLAGFVEVLENYNTKLKSIGLQNNEIVDREEMENLTDLLK